MLSAIKSATTGLISPSIAPLPAARTEHGIFRKTAAEHLLSDRSEWHCLHQLPTARFTATATANRTSPFTVRQTAVFTGSTVLIRLFIPAFNSVSQASSRLPDYIPINGSYTQHYIKNG